jgi:hypothetical protein
MRRHTLLLAALCACRTVPTPPDPAALGGTPACAASFHEELDAIAWRKNVVLGLEVSGALAAIAGPAVAVVGIASDPEPATQPVEAFVLGGSLVAAGVAAVIGAGALASDADVHAERARAAYAQACR